MTTKYFGTEKFDIALKEPPSLRNFYPSLLLTCWNHISWTTFPCFISFFSFFFNQHTCLLLPYPNCSKNIALKTKQQQKKSVGFSICCFGFLNDFHINALHCDLSLSYTSFNKLLYRDIGTCIFPFVKNVQIQNGRFKSLQMNKVTVILCFPP